MIRFILDSSAYYGPSEVIVGKALYNIRDKYPRNSYMICTKAGRVEEDKFDYSPEHIRFSVERSLERFHTSYLDVLYLHDVEFVSSDAAVGALVEMFKLKQEGKVHHVGMSGYPLDYLLALAKYVHKELGHPLDLILSYSNFCLQNTLLGKFVPKLQDKGPDGAGIETVLCASPLSMGLLRSQKAPGFHPASDSLKAAVEEASKYTQSQGTDLADLAVRFAMRNWKTGPYVYGMSSIQEVENAVKVYWQVNGSGKDSLEIKESDAQLTQKVQEIFQKYKQLDATWPSGIEHPDLLPKSE